jgi:hypothetical protein
MRIPLTSLIALLPLASPVLAGDISLGLPIDCTLGDTCYIQSFVDDDPSDAASDFTCGSLSYDGHKGTDFALPSTRDMWTSVDVFAAAAGTVQGTRDGMDDRPQGVEGAPDVSGRECGNGLVIDHGDGWETQYCHMMKGSVAVKTGESVAQGTVLGHVGLSGDTEFPHVHLSVRKDGKVIDPFNPSGSLSCGETGDRTLWQDTLTYQATGLLAVGITDGVPDYAQMKNGPAQITSLPANSPAMVVYGFAFGGQTGDIMSLSLAGPNGTIADNQVTLSKNQAQYFNAAGRKSKTPWPVGGYNAMVQILRGGAVISTRSYSIVVTP